MCCKYWNLKFSCVNILYYWLSQHWGSGQFSHLPDYSSTGFIAPGLMETLSGLAQSTPGASLTRLGSDWPSHTWEPPHPLPNPLSGLSPETLRQSSKRLTPPYRRHLPPNQPLPAAGGRPDSACVASGIRSSGSSHLYVLRVSNKSCPSNSRDGRNKVIK